MENNIFFTKQNYILIVAGLVICALGYVIMAGGGSEDPNEFSYEIFSHRHITYSTILWFIGTIVIFVGIMKKFRPDELADPKGELSKKK